MEGARLRRYLKFVFNFFMTSFCLAACFERWNMEGSQDLALSIAPDVLGAVPPLSFGSCSKHMPMSQHSHKIQLGTHNALLDRNSIA